jgi:4-hydroxythreonine-4-phosphate dehydrogenase
MKDRQQQLPVIAITVGEPAGIGAEVLIKALQQSFDAHLVIIGDPKHLQKSSEQLNERFSYQLWTAKEDLGQKPSISLLPIVYPEPIVCGKLNPNNAATTVQSLKIAHDLAQSNAVDAIFTGPVHKGNINDSGIAFSGHTEFFADAAACKQVVMMLATEAMRVALVTTHLPLRAVADAITKEKVEDVINITLDSLSDVLHKQTPKLAVLGLNPHAGEDGHLGMEEIDIIQPVISKISNERDIQITGPLPADTAFQQKYLDSFDAIVAMYHDQGLPVLKYSGFGQAVNITLGLPYLRASVDHGTALNIAGKGIADPSSFLYALKYTIGLVNHKAST